jgi:hypothetical protein
MRVPTLFALAAVGSTQIPSFGLEVSMSRGTTGLALSLPQLSASLGWIALASLMADVDSFAVVLHGAASGE